MRKMSMEWHRECLKNSLESLRRKELACENMRDEVERMRRRLAVYQRQIDRATKEKRDGFDMDKFNQPKETP